jgi:hypothetical protein
MLLLWLQPCAAHPDPQPWPQSPRQIQINPDLTMARECHEWMSFLQ